MVKNLPANAGDAKDADSIPGSGRTPGGENVNPAQNSCLENSTERGAWQESRGSIAGAWQESRGSIAGAWQESRRSIAGAWQESRGSIAGAWQESVGPQSWARMSAHIVFRVSAFTFLVAFKNIMVCILNLSESVLN